MRNMNVSSPFFRKGQVSGHMLYLKGFSAVALPCDFISKISVTDLPRCVNRIIKTSV